MVDRLYPTPCVGLNILRISDAKMPHELDASEMRYDHAKPDASEMRKMWNPTCMHVGYDETARHNSASEMRGNAMWEGYKKFALPLPSIRELQD